MNLKVKKLTSSAKLPEKAHLSDAGFDIFTTEDYNLKPGETHLFDTGIACELPIGYCALIWDRSGLGSKGIHRLAGVIDSSYRGEWKVALVNLSNLNHTASVLQEQSAYKVKAGDKIAQVIIQKVEPFSTVEVDELSETNRGDSGFGSTGR